MESVIQPVAETRGKRRYRTVEERLRVVQETLADGVSVAVVARRHGVNANQVFHWHLQILVKSPNYEYVNVSWYCRCNVKQSNLCCSFQHNIQTLKGNVMKKALVCGAGGFIGSHLVKRLKSEDYWVRGVDLKLPEYDETAADDFQIADLRLRESWQKILDPGFDEVYQLAADMGGAGFVFSGVNDAAIMHNSAMINLHSADFAVKSEVKRLFYSSSACMYPAYNQVDASKPNCAESSAYPAAPDSEYGWEKLFSERLYFAFQRNCDLDVHIARFHNIFGPLGTWTGGREKAPAALCRKIAETPDGGEIEIWGDGEQTRSFMYIDECVEGIRRLISSDFSGPVNIGSEEMVTINGMAETIMEIAGKKLSIKHISGPLGVRGRNSDNRLIREKLGWAPSRTLREGLEKTYAWIFEQVEAMQSTK